MKRLMPDYGDGLTRIFHHDEMTGVSTIETQCDLEPFLDHMQSQRSHWDGRNKEKDFYKVGELPAWLIKYWIQEEGWNPFDPNNRKKLMQTLNDPNFQNLRVWDGQLGTKGLG